MQNAGSKNLVASFPEKTKVLIVGGGPSGLVALKEFREAGFDAVCYEADPGVGGAFRVAYENMFLTISNRLMGYSDFPDPAPLEYSTRERYVEYLEAYAILFGLNPYLHFNTTITGAKINAHGKWEVTAEQEGTTLNLMADRLIVCTGSNHTPKKAPTPGYTGNVLHSSEWRGATNNEQIAGKRVIVVGSSESAADVSADSAETAKSVVLWTRRSVPIGPRFLNEKSNDELTSMKNQRNDPPKVYDMLESVTVTQASQLETSKHYADERVALWKGLVKMNDKSAMHLLGLYCLGACEAVKDGIKRTDQVFAVPKTTRLLTAVSRGKVDLYVAKNAQYDGTEVTFSGFYQKNFQYPMDPSHKEVYHADVIIMCTGFKTDFAWLDADIDYNARTWFKNCIPPGYEDKLAFLGWTRPHQGAIPACSEMLARYLCLLYTGQKFLPADWKQQTKREKDIAENWYTEAPGYSTVVDYPSFMTSMAKLIGCEPVRPSIFNFKRFVQYYTFPVWPAFYRTQGPGARPEMLDYCLNQHGTFEALVPGGQPIGGLLAWRRALFQVMFVNPLFYAITMLTGKRDDLGFGWYSMKSKRYVGMHGVNMGFKDIIAPNA